MENVMNNSRLKLAISVIIFIILILGVFSCNSTDVINTSFEVLENCNLQNVDSIANGTGLSAVELVIANQSDYEKYIVYNGPMEVDFNEEFVIAGRSTWQTHGVRVKEQSLQLISDILRYRVIIGDMDYQMPERAEYGIVVSKAYMNYQVDFIVEKED
jgi:hypothetical protein